MHSVNLSAAPTALISSPVLSRPDLLKEMLTRSNMCTYLMELCVPPKEQCAVLLKTTKQQKVLTSLRFFSHIWAELSLFHITKKLSRDSLNQRRRRRSVLTRKLSPKVVSQPLKRLRKLRRKRNEYINLKICITN
jgi:hypothetical protein